MKYPSLVYKDGGKFKRPGGTYSYRAVNSDADMQAAITLGWYDNLEDAISKKEVKQKKEAKPKKEKVIE